MWSTAVWGPSGGGTQKKALKIVKTFSSTLLSAFCLDASSGSRPLPALSVFLPPWDQNSLRTSFLCGDARSLSKKKLKNCWALFWHLKTQLPRHSTSFIHVPDLITDPLLFSNWLSCPLLPWNRKKSCSSCCFFLKSSSTIIAVDLDRSTFTFLDSELVDLTIRRQHVFPFFLLSYPSAHCN